MRARKGSTRAPRPSPLARAAWTRARLTLNASTPGIRSRTKTMDRRTKTLDCCTTVVHARTPELHASTKKMQRCRSGTRPFRAWSCIDATLTFVVPPQSCSHATRPLARACFSWTHACLALDGSIPAASRADEIRARVQVFGGRVQVGRSWLHQRGASLQPWTFACRCGPCAIATSAAARVNLTWSRQGTTCMSGTGVGGLSGIRVDRCRQLYDAPATPSASTGRVACPYLKPLLAG